MRGPRSRAGRGGNGEAVSPQASARRDPPSPPPWAQLARASHRGLCGQKESDVWLRGPHPTLSSGHSLAARPSQGEFPRCTSSPCSVSDPTHRFAIPNPRGLLRPPRAAGTRPGTLHRTPHQRPDSVLPVSLEGTSCQRSARVRPGLPQPVICVQQGPIWLTTEQAPWGGLQAQEILPRKAG